MSLATEKLYYRRGDTTYSIDTYTAASDCGTNYMCMRSGGNTRYIGLGDTTNSNASHLRVFKNSTIFAILKTIVSIVYVGVWTLHAQFRGKGTTKTYTISVDYNRVYSSSDLTNLKIDGVFNRVTIDGVMLLDGAAINYQTRLTTGSHTVAVRANSDTVYTYIRKIV